MTIIYLATPVKRCWIWNLRCMFERLIHQTEMFLTVHITPFLILGVKCFYRFCVCVKIWSCFFFSSSSHSERPTVFDVSLMHNRCLSLQKICFKHGVLGKVQDKRFIPSTSATHITTVTCPWYVWAHSFLSSRRVSSTHLYLLCFLRMSVVLLQIIYKNVK